MTFDEKISFENGYWVGISFLSKWDYKKFTIRNIISTSSFFMPFNIANRYKTLPKDAYLPTGIEFDIDYKIKTFASFFLNSSIDLNQFIFKIGLNFNYKNVDLRLNYSLTQKKLSAGISCAKNKSVKKIRTGLHPIKIMYTKHPKREDTNLNKYKDLNQLKAIESLKNTSLKNFTQNNLLQVEEILKLVKIIKSNDINLTNGNLTNIIQLSKLEQYFFQTLIENEEIIKKTIIKEKIANQKLKKEFFFNHEFLHLVKNKLVATENLTISYVENDGRHRNLNELIEKSNEYFSFGNIKDKEAILVFEKINFDIRQGHVYIIYIDHKKRLILESDSANHNSDLQDSHTIKVNDNLYFARRYTPCTQKRNSSTCTLHAFANLQSFLWGFYSVNKPYYIRERNLEVIKDYLNN